MQGLLTAQREVITEVQQQRINGVLLLSQVTNQGNPEGYRLRLPVSAPLSIPYTVPLTDLNKSPRAATLTLISNLLG